MNCYHSEPKRKLEQWFWSGVFGEAYGGTVETQFALDLEEVARWIRGGPTPRLVVEATFTPERLLTLRTRNSAAYKGLYALQMKNGARDWRTKPVSGIHGVHWTFHRYTSYISTGLV